MSDIYIPGVTRPLRRPRVKLAVILLVLAYVLWIGVNAVRNAHELQLQMVCAANLKGIAAAFAIYGREGWDGKTPAVQWLIDRGHVESRQAICPSSKLSPSNYVLAPLPPESLSKKPSPPWGRGLGEGENPRLLESLTLTPALSLEGRGGSQTRTAGSFNNRAIVAYEPKSNHGDGGNVVFADGHAEFLRGDDYDKLVGLR